MLQDCRFHHCLFEALVAKLLCIVLNSLIYRHLPGSQILPATQPATPLAGVLVIFSAPLLWNCATWLVQTTVMSFFPFVLKLVLWTWVLRKAHRNSSRDILYVQCLCWHFMSSLKPTAHDRRHRENDSPLPKRPARWVFSHQSELSRCSGTDQRPAGLVTEALQAQHLPSSDSLWIALE